MSFYASPIDIETAYPGKSGDAKLQGLPPQQRTRLPATEVLM
ncbi:hypothetical protein BBR47_55510 [Brevibacillus brevis NBRC 100599]|uniref:Uncharacterized protein n=1 Tax=Brevibacillus brevis (strain 47 / JCM 6285 / NBRC 100599) TaxID=358681 RepID=C0Z8A1_BREBN|nr:hypothetical protein BBR47_55510 [Brevibacillus brevis NBRC 100599]